MASKKQLIKKIESRLPLVLASDRLAARREIQRIKVTDRKAGSGQNFERRFERLLKRLESSEQKRRVRLANLPELRFNEDLPIFAKKDEIVEAIAGHQVVVVSGETGSGKTTQLPKFCMAAGRGIDGLIGCTQPRRIAATTVAHRVAEELGQDPGRAVGYKIRFKDRTSRDAYIKFMTDGILLAETQGDRYLRAYDTIIVDEAHERSLNIDFILGILQTLLRKRDDLKLIITSATIDTEKFSKAFNAAPVIEVSGRLYPVEVRYLQPDAAPADNGELTHVDLAARAAMRLLKQGSGGDILVFMPTEQDIRETCELLEGDLPAGVRILPLFARLTAAEQNRVFARFAERKIIVATNVAETSITIPGIKYVIDSGLARISRYSPRTRTTSLPVTPVSKSSCDQRKGRCGRVQNGVCIRLFSEDDYQARPQFTPPEILRANLAEVILRMVALELGDVAQFPFIDRPAAKSINDGFDLLFELGAIKKRQRTEVSGQKTEDRLQRSEYPGREASADAGSRNRVVLTEKGRMMARIPLDPRLSRMLLEAQKEGCVPEITIIAAALSIQDPRERPAEKTREADRMHALFDDPHSDFVTLLNIWNRYHVHWQKVKSSNQMKRFCREHYLAFKRMREWRDIHSQIQAILEEQGLLRAEARRRNAESGTQNAASVAKGIREAAAGDLRQFSTEQTATGNLMLSDDKYAQIHRSVLSGFLSNIAVRKEKNIFKAAQGREVMIFPGSGIFDKARNWIVAAEVVETSRVFARTVANIDSAWLEDLGQDLCKYTYLNPHWEKNRGEVVASEQVSLFGLIIVSERKVSYGTVHPDEASDIFIQNALIDGDVKKPFAFMKHNLQLIEDIRDLQNRLRRRDLLIGEPELFDFYKQRLPAVYDIRTLAKFLKRNGNDRFLRMRREDLILYDPDEAEIAQFPDRLEIAGHPFNCTYAFEPGAEDDGVTVKIPAPLAPAVSPEAVDWLVPGLIPEKIESLIKGLPKAYRKKLVPVKDTVAIICREMAQVESSLISALGEFIYSRFGVDIPAAAWSDKTLPDHLKMRIAITAPDGKELDVGRDASILRRQMDETVESDEFKMLQRKWEKSGIAAWDFGDLPDFISESFNRQPKWVAYPALEKDATAEKRVNLRLYQQRDKALALHRQGVLTLYAIHFSKDLKFLKRQLKIPADQSYLADYFGGAKKLEQRLYQHHVQTLFGKNIRSKNDFYAHAAQTGPQILAGGRQLLEGTLAVLKAYNEARSEIFKIQSGYRGNANAVKFFEELINSLASLVPANFFEIYDQNQFLHLERYIKAVLIRAQRAPLDFEKDQAKANEIRKFVDGLNGLLKALSPTVSAEKRQAIEDYFWLLEEFKVSVFAQELKTAVPVSAKRLADKLGQIERMV